MNLIQILDRIGREINQSVFDNKQQVTRDDMLNAISDCNDEMSDLNLPFNEATPVTGTWAANTAYLDIDAAADLNLSDFDRVRRLELDNIKAYPISYDELDRLRGSFDTTSDANLPVNPPVYMEDHGRLYRWPYNESRSYKLWYYKQLAAITAGVDQSLYTSGNTYTVPTSIAETATHRQTFTPTQANQAGIMININADGSDPVTVTVHNSSNVSQGSKTIYNPGIGMVMFPIAWTWAAGSYHFHVTVAGSGTTKLNTTTDADLETAQFESWYADTPVIPSRYHIAYVYFATASALRKLDNNARAEVYDDGKEFELGGRSKYRSIKYLIKSKMATKLSDDRPPHIIDVLESDYNWGDD